MKFISIVPRVNNELPDAPNCPVVKKKWLSKFLHSVTVNASMTTKLNTNANETNIDDQIPGRSRPQYKLPSVRRSTSLRFKRSIRQARCGKPRRKNIDTIWKPNYYQRYKLQRADRSAKELSDGMRNSNDSNSMRDTADVRYLRSVSRLGKSSGTRRESKLRRTPSSTDVSVDFDFLDDLPLSIRLSLFRSRIDGSDNIGSCDSDANEFAEDPASSLSHEVQDTNESPSTVTGYTSPGAVFSATDEGDIIGRAASSSNASTDRDSADCDSTDYASVEMSLCADGSGTAGSIGPCDFDRLFYRITNPTVVLARDQYIEGKMPLNKPCSPTQHSTVLEHGIVRTEEYSHRDANFSQNAPDRNFEESSDCEIQNGISLLDFYENPIIPHYRETLLLNKAKHKPNHSLDGVMLNSNGREDISENAFIDYRSNEPQSLNATGNPGSVEPNPFEQCSSSISPSLLSTSPTHMIEIDRTVSIECDLIQEKLQSSIIVEPNLSAVESVPNTCQYLVPTSIESIFSTVQSMRPISLTSEFTEISTNSSRSTPIEQSSTQEDLQPSILVGPNSSPVQPIPSTSIIRDKIESEISAEFIKPKCTEQDPDQTAIEHNPTKTRKGLSDIEKSYIIHVIKNVLNDVNFAEKLSTHLGAEFFNDFYKKFEDGSQSKSVASNENVSTILIDPTNEFESEVEKQPGLADQDFSEVDLTAEIQNILDSGTDYRSNGNDSDPVIIDNDTPIVIEISSNTTTSSHENSFDSSIGIESLIEIRSNATTNSDENLLETSIEDAIDIDESNPEEGCTAPTMKSQPAPNIRQTQSIACTSTALETDEGGLRNLGPLVQEPLAMIDATRLSNSLATALRDRPTEIPKQPNRSLPLRPAPPVPTRSKVDVLHKQYLRPDTLRSANLNAGNSANEHSDTSCNSAISGDVVNIICINGSNRMESMDEDDSCNTGHGKKCGSSFEHRKAYYVEHNKTRITSDSDWEMSEHDESASETADDRARRGRDMRHEFQRNKLLTPPSQIGDKSSGNEVSLEDEDSQTSIQKTHIGRSKRSADREKIVPPLKLKKISQNKVSEPLVSLSENVSSESTNYRVVTGATPAPSPAPCNYQHSVLELNFGKSQFRDMNENTFNLSHPANSGETRTVQSKDRLISNFYTETNPIIAARSTRECVENDACSGRTATSGALISGLSKPERMNPKRSSTDGARRNLQNASAISNKESHSNCLSKPSFIPTCPAAIPISVARRYSNFVPIELENDVRSKDIGTSKSNEIINAYFPSMPTLEEDSVQSSSVDMPLAESCPSPKRSEQLETSRIVVNGNGYSQYENVDQTPMGKRRPDCRVQTASANSISQQAAQLIDKSMTVSATQQKSEQLLTGHGRSVTGNPAAKVILPIQIQIPEYSPNKTNHNLPRRTSVIDVRISSPPKTPSPLPLSPGIQEALNQHKMKQEQEKIEAEKKRLAIIGEGTVRERDEWKMQESLVAQIRTQARETAESRKKTEQDEFEKKTRINGIGGRGETLQQADGPTINGGQRQNHDELSEDQRQHRQQAAMVEQRKELLDRLTDGQIQRGNLQNIQDEANSPRTFPLQQTSAAFIGQQDSVQQKSSPKMTAKLRAARKKYKSSQSKPKSDKDKLKFRRQKLNCRLKELTNTALNLRQQMFSTEDASQRPRMQQMMNLNQKQIENTRKYLSKLSSDEIAMYSNQFDESDPSVIQVRMNVGQKIPSPEPPRLSPSNDSNIVASDFTIRNSPPILPRVGLTIPNILASPPATENPRKNMENCGKADIPQSSRVMESNPEIRVLSRTYLTENCANLPNINHTEATQNSKELENRFNVPRNPIETSPRDLSRVPNTTSPNNNSIKGNFPNTTLAQSCNNLLVSVNSTLKNTARVRNSMNDTLHLLDKVVNEQRQSVDQNIPSSNSSLLMAVATGESSISHHSASLRNGSVATMNIGENGRPINNYMTTSMINITRPITSVSSNPAATISHAQPLSNGVFNQPVHLTDYRRMESTHNMLSRENGGANINLHSPLQAHPALALPGSYHRQLGAQGYTTAVEASLGRQLTQRLNQNPGVEPVMSFTIDKDGSLIPSTPPVQSQRLQAQLPEELSETMRPARPTMSSNRAPEVASTKHHKHRIMSEAFPTLGNWAAQMTKKPVHRRTRKKPVVDPAYSETPDKTPSGFRAPGSDMYKMSATAIDIPRPTTVNNTSAWHDQHSLRQGFYNQQNITHLYHNDYPINPYGATSVGYPCLYPYTSYQYHHTDALNPHRMHPPSMNNHHVQHPGNHTLLQSTQHYVSGMLAHATMPGSFQSQASSANFRNSNDILSPEYLRISPSAMSSITSQGYHNTQFRIPGLPSVAQSAQLSQSATSKRTYLSPQLAANVSSTQLDHSVTSSQFPSNSSKSRNNQGLNMTRNCETPHLGRVEQSPNTLNNLKCSYCGLAGPMFNCLGCEMSFYCGEACQIQHWAVHVMECPKRMPKLKKFM